MILSMTEQARLFLISAVMGFLLGFCYDWIRVFRRTVRHLEFFVQAEDILYWICSCGILFFVLLKKNYGEIRAFLIIGTFIGMVLYFNTLSPFFIKVSVTVICFIKKIICIILEIILTPFKILTKILCIPYRFFVIGLIKIKKKLKMLLKKFLFCAKIIRYKYILDNRLFGLKRKRRIKKNRDKLN